MVRSSPHTDYKQTTSYSWAINKRTEQVAQDQNALQPLWEKGIAQTCSQIEELLFALCEASSAAEFHKFELVVWGLRKALWEM